MDLGGYCINAARYLFQDDPIEVTGFAAHTPSTKFQEVPEMVTASPPRCKPAVGRIALIVGTTPLAFVPQEPISVVVPEK